MLAKCHCAVHVQIHLHVLLGYLTGTPCSRMCVYVCTCSKKYFGVTLLLNMSFHRANLVLSFRAESSLNKNKLGCLENWELQNILSHLRPKHGFGRTFPENMKVCRPSIEATFAVTEVEVRLTIGTGSCHFLPFYSRNKIGRVRHETHLIICSFFFFF